MCEAGKDIDYAEFHEAVGDELGEWAQDHNYDADLQLMDDMHVAYFRSTWGEHEVCYLVWSGFEMIFVPEGFNIEQPRNRLLDGMETWGPND